ncbi:Ig-like domain-containing protein [Enterobacter cloacae]|uniref:Ig-like domain-containing protein n=1 Tax=Enterobacter cloacae TaxID=550 RepID=UPI001F5E131A|nr:Ig-like domain-containing protein [Enterobacter cloacae]
MHVNKNLTICLQVFFYLHFTFCNAFLFSFPAHAETNQNVEINTKSGENNIAGVLAGAGSLLSQDNKSDAIINSLINSGSGKATNEIQQWLQQFGTASVNIGLDQNFSLESANLDLLLPLYDDKGGNLLFTQLGGRREDDRNLFNVGLGYRYFADSWMWGVNAFYDQQISGNTHQRMGVGGELGWDFLKLSANGYKRLSGWKTSSEHLDYEERVADGYDVRTEGYLPVHPQLGAKLVWEQYYGDDVALFGDDDDDRQKNPYAVTAGINYTPFPLISFGLNQKMGKGDQLDTQVELNVNWMPGVPIATQLDSEKVKERRTLLGSRMDLVNRNNNIVLEYRKQELISLSLPERIEGVESKTVPVTVSVKTKYPVDHIVWQDDNLVRNGGKISEKNGAWFVVLPHYEQNGAEKNRYVVSATAYDNRGNKSDTAYMTVAVNGFDVTQVTSDTTSESTHLPADGVSTTQIMVTLTSGGGQKITGLARHLSSQLLRASARKKTFSADPVSEKMTAFREQSAGVYVSTFTSGNVPGDVTIQPLYDTTKLNKTVVTLDAMDDSQHLDRLEASKNSALANGQDAITLTAHVVNVANEPVQGAQVKWQGDNSHAVFSAAQSRSDAQGNATVSVTSHDVVRLTVNAQLENGQSMTGPALQFTADAGSAVVTHLEADKTVAKADNQDTITLNAVVTDANRHPLVNQPVQWAINSANTSVHLADKQSNTNEQGVATISIASAKAGQGVVSATAGNSETVTSDKLTFVADSESAMLGALTASKTSALANGQDAISLQVKVEDANKNPVKGATVDWSAGSATARLSGTSTETNALGIATIEVTSANIETLEVTATMGGQTQTSPALSFTVDSATAVVKTLNVDKSQATANNNDRITLTAEVVDANDHPVPASALQWSIVQGQGTLSASQNATNESGMGSVTLTATQQGTVVVSVNTATGTAVNSPELAFVADTATGKVSQVTTDKTTAVADGKDKVTYTATVTDANGNPLQGMDVNWNVTPSFAKPSSTTSRTGADGTASVTVTTLKAADVSLTAQAGTGSAWNAPVVTFTADSTTAQIGDLSVSKATALANGMDSITFTGAVTDTNGNPVSGETAVWSMVPATGVLSSTTSESDARGNVSVTLKSDLVADYRVKATVNGHEETSDSVSFTADTTTAAIRTLVADKTSDIAAGNDTVTLTATVLDNSNHPVPGATVLWSGDNPNGVFSESSSTTDSDGKSSVTWSSTLAKETLITAKSSNNSEKALQFHVVPDLQSAIPVTVVADKSSAAANSTDQITLTATVKDRYGNAVHQANVGWQVTPAGDYQLSATEQTADDAGQSVVTLSSADVVACRAVATFNGVNKPSATLRYVADVATEHVSQIVASKTADIVAGKDVITLQATVVDDDDHPVSDAVVHWGTDNESGQFQPADSSTTNSEGIAEITFTASTALPTRIGAGINHTQETLTVNYIGNAETAMLSTIKADKSKAVADNTERVTWSTTVKDANGNVLPGVTVNWRSDSAAMTLSGNSSVTDANGIATVSGTTTKAGDVVMTATLPTRGLSLSAGKVSFVGDVKTAGLVSLSADKSVALSNGMDSAKYTAVVKDVNQNLVPDASISWQTTMNNLSAASTKTNASGIATVKLSGHGVGMVTVSASVNSSTLSDSSVKFINIIEDTWVINSNSSSYSSASIGGYPSLGFVTVAPTNGPTSLAWAPSGYAAVSTPVILTDGSGKQYSVNLKGYRQSDCSQRPLNAAVGCNGGSGMRAKFTYARTDNPDLPAGHYTGLVHFLGKDWHTSYAFEYRLTMDLTVY